jgi:hypothetical protein
MEKNMINPSQSLKSSSSPTTTRLCAYCKCERDWIWSGQKLKDGSKVYTDHGGLRWAGRRCPVCEKSRVASAVRHDHFDRDMIFNQLAERGFKVLSKTHPILVEKGGQTLQVGIRRARMNGASIMIESGPDLRDDFVALVFESVRLVPVEQLANMAVFSPTKGAVAETASPMVVDNGCPSGEQSF